MKHFKLFPLLILLLGTGFLSACSSSVSTQPTPAPSATLAAPPVMDFGTVGVGQTRDTLLRVTNIGTDSLYINSETVTAGFTVHNLTALPIKLAKGGYQDIGVSFPAVDAASHTGTLIFSFNAAGGLAQSDTIQLKGAGAFYHAGTSTTYTYQGYNTDSSSNKVSGSDYTSTAVVIGTGLSYRGMSNVTAIAEGADTTYFRYESNGDITLYSKGVPVDAAHGVYLTPGWWTLPTGSHATGVVLAKSDTTARVLVQGNSLPVAFNVMITADYVGADSVKLASETLSTSKVKVLVSVKGTYLTISQQTTATIFYDYGLKIGYLARLIQSRVSAPKLIGGPDGGSFKVLTQYQLK